jgi:hypothetical protein
VLTFQTRARRHFSQVERADEVSPARKFDGLEELLDDIRLFGDHLVTSTGAHNKSQIPEIVSDHRQSH